MDPIQLPKANKQPRDKAVAQREQLNNPGRQSRPKAGQGARGAGRSPPGGSRTSAGD